MFGHDGLNSGLVSAHHLANLGAVLEEEKGRHCADAQLLGEFGQLVDVDLVEAAVGIGFGHLNDFRGNHFARAAPGGEAVDDNKRGFFDEFMKLSTAVDGDERGLVRGSSIGGRKCARN